MMDMADWTEAERAWMARALDLAAQGRYSSRPNPMVGCVLVRDGQLVGEGWHARTGEAHAEVHALRQAGERARGATAFVTLEPCAHHGRTPPCAEALVAAGVVEVIAAHVDPDPRVAGNGLQCLREAGIALRCGLLESEARALNRGFLSRIQRGRPWLRLKLALSLDGRMALRDGRAAWITGPAARADGHRYRAQAGVIVAGIGSVLADDPQLSVRLPQHDEGYGTAAVPAPTLPLLLDSRARLPDSARLLSLHPAILWAVADSAEVMARARRLAAAHPPLQLLPCPLAAGRIDLFWLLGELARRQVNEIHAEAGPSLADALLQAELVDELLIYQAGRCLGAGALQPFRWPLAAVMPERRWTALESRLIEGDLMSRWLRSG